MSGPRLHEGHRHLPGGYGHGGTRREGLPRYRLPPGPDGAVAGTARLAVRAGSGAAFAVQKLVNRRLPYALQWNLLLSVGECPALTPPRPRSLPVDGAGPRGEHSPGCGSGAAFAVVGRSPSRSPVPGGIGRCSRAAAQPALGGEHPRAGLSSGRVLGQLHGDQSGDAEVLGLLDLFGDGHVPAGAQCG